MQARATLATCPHVSRRRCALSLLVVHVVGVVSAIRTPGNPWRVSAWHAAVVARFPFPARHAVAVAKANTVAG